MIMKRWVMYAVRVDDSRLHFCNPRYQMISVSSAWAKEIPHFFNISSSGQIKDLKMYLAPIEKELEETTITKQYINGSIQQQQYTQAQL